MQNSFTYTLRDECSRVNSEAVYLAATHRQLKKRATDAADQHSQELYEHAYENAVIAIRELKGDDREGFLRLSAYVYQLAKCEYKDWAGMRFTDTHCTLYVEKPVEIQKAESE